MQSRLWNRRCNDTPPPHTHTHRHGQRTSQGEGTQPPSPVATWVRYCKERDLPSSQSLPTLLDSCEIADSHPNQTICHRRPSCQQLTEIAGQFGTNFSRCWSNKSALSVILKFMKAFQMRTTTFCGLRSK